MALSLPPCPPSLRAVAHFLKLAVEHDSRDPVVSYWARLTALQTGMTLDKSSKAEENILQKIRKKMVVVEIVEKDPNTL